MKKKVIGIGIMSIIAMVLVLSLAFLVPTTTATAVTSGGQVYVGKNVTFNLDGGTISGGNAENGGGVYSSGAIMNMTNGEISGNTATNGGGAYLTEGSILEMTEGEISGNTATNGGGVYLDGSIMVMHAGKIVNNTADHGSAIYLTGGASLHLSGGEINGTIECDGADLSYYVSYYDCTFSGGYIDVGSGISIIIDKVPTKDIPIKCDLKPGTIVASLGFKIPATTDLLSHIKVQGMPDDMELKYDEYNNIILANKIRTVTFSVINSEYGNLDKTSIEVPYGSTYSVSSNVMTFTKNGEIVATVTATTINDTDQYDYALSQWSEESGTITENITITATFTRTIRTYKVSFSPSPSSTYGRVSRTSVTVPYGTTWSTSDNVLTFANGSTASVTAMPATATTSYTYSFSSWSPATGTVTSDTTITVIFTRITRGNCTVSFDVQNSSYGTFNSAALKVPSGTKVSVTGNVISFIEPSTEKVVASRTATPKPASGNNMYTFSGYSTGDGLLYDMTIESDVTIQLLFMIGTPCTVTFKAGGFSSGGKVSQSSITVATYTSYNAVGNVMYFSDGQSVTATAGSSSYPFLRWSEEQGIITMGMTITATFGRRAADPVNPEQPGIEEYSGETAFIDKRRGEYINVVNTYYKQYKNYDICYPR